MFWLFKSGPLQSLWHSANQPTSRIRRERATRSAQFSLSAARRKSLRLGPLDERRLLSGNLTTARYDNSRDAANTNETVLTSSDVDVSSFGKIAGGLTVGSAGAFSPPVVPAAAAPAVSSSQDSAASPPAAMSLSPHGLAAAMADPPAPTVSSAAPRAAAAIFPTVHSPNLSQLANNVAAALIGHRFRKLAFQILAFQSPIRVRLAPRRSRNV